MSRTRRNHRPVRFTICTALAAALVAGCAGQGRLANAGGQSPHGLSGGTAQGELDLAVAKAEQRVQNNVRSASARFALAEAYLHAGRFDSAATTYNDAIALGETGQRTVLGLALANIGSGRSREAVAVLDTWGASLPVGDLGLALALAGDTNRGVALLSDALRGGENTPKLRQNLAYAYALDGRWLEARLIAAQDVPAEQLDARISEWARQGRPEDYQQRVAGLLGAPVRSDAGQPVSLALNGPAAPAERVAEAVSPQPAPVPRNDSDDEELPPVASSHPAAFVDPRQVAPIRARPVSDTAPAETAADSRGTAPRYVSEPVVQKIAARSIKPVAKASVPQWSSAAVAKTPAISACSDDDCTHNVQLGAFSSEKNARFARDLYLSRNPELKNYELQITQAFVRGKNFWRVTAIGFDRSAASGLCSSVKSRGGNCFAYASASPLPGAKPHHEGAGPTLARR